VRILLTFYLTLALALPAIAQQGNGSGLPGLSDVLPTSSGQENQKEKTEKEQPGERERFPGVAELAPRLAALNGEQAEIEQRLDTLKDQSDIRQQIERTRERQKLVNERMEKHGGPAGWNVNRLRENRQLIQRQQEQFQSILDQLSDRLAHLDDTRKEWNKKRQFWEEWKTDLEQRQGQFAEDSFSRALDSIDSVLSAVRQEMKPLLELQSQVTELHAHNSRYVNRIDAMLDSRRQEIFSKTGPPLFSPDYYRQYGEDLWKAVDEGVKDVRWLSRNFLKEQGWILLLQAIVAISLPLLIRRYRSEAQEAEEWQFILDHPWATGIFVAVSSLTFLYSYPPALAQVFFWALAAFSAAVLIAALLLNPRKIFMVYVLAFLFVFSMLLNTIALPLPIYRLYIALLSLFGAPALWLLAKHNLKARNRNLGNFTISLRIGAIVLLATCVAQFWGYSRLAMRIVESSIETVFLVLFVMMVIRVGSGGIEFGLGRPFMKRYRFFRKHGKELSRRLKNIFRILILIYAFLYLLTVWNVFDTVGQSWERFGQIGFSMGDTDITLKMIGLAGFVFYLSIIFSWVMQAVLDTGVLSRRQVDRGVRDSIKKLLHYILVLIGFVIALKLAGFALENFVVLAGAFGIGIGFGLQNIVNNFVSGIILLFERPVKVGDMVVVDEEWGRVRKIGLRSTIVETLDQAEIIVPNSQFISEKVTNWSLTTSIVRIVIPVGVAYGSNVEKVLQVFEDVCHFHDEVLSEPKPSPIFVGFGNSSLDFEVRVWISDVETRLRIRSELCQAIDRAFREQDITIPFPQRDLHLRSMEGAFAESVRSLREEETDTAR